MRAFSYVDFPTDFVTLLKASIRPTYEDKEKVNAIIFSRPSLMALIEMSFRDVLDGKSFEVLLPSLGWRPFRDRLATVIVKRKMDGFYSGASTDTSAIADILQFEARYSPFLIGEYSRGFLLGLFLKFQGEYPPDEVLDVLKRSDHRLMRVDWLILSVWHWIDMLGKEYVLHTFQNSSAPTEELMERLTHDQKELMMRNLLRYAYASDDQDFLTQVRV